MENRKVTLKMLANRINVSTSTVSKALNDSYEISEKTKERIKKIANFYNYKPNRLAANLKFGTTRTIGVIIPDIQNYFFTQVLLGIEKMATKNNYSIIISISDESLYKEASIMGTLSCGIVDGFIIAVAEETQVNKRFEHFKLAKDYGRQIVMFDRIVNDISCDKVIVDDYEAVYNVTKHLINTSRKDIALVSTIGNLSVGKSRKKGYIDAILNEYGFVNKSLIIESTVDTIKISIEKLFFNNKIDAIIALDEEASLISLEKTKSKGFIIPKQLALIGYIGEKIASNLSPLFSTINQHGVEIGKTTARILIDKLNTNSKEIKDVIIKSTFNLRGTAI